MIKTAKAFTKRLDHLFTNKETKDIRIRLPLIGVFKPHNSAVTKPAMEHRRNINAHLGVVLLLPLETKFNIE
jgi:hypothetical protein